MLKDVQWYTNRPFLPNQLRYINALIAAESGESLISLLAPIRGAISITEKSPEAAVHRP